MKPTLLLGLLLGVAAQATPIEIQISGIVGQGRIGTDPYTAVDIAGLPFTVRITAGDELTLTGPGFFSGLPSMSLEVQGFGTRAMPHADFLRFSQNITGGGEHLWAPYGFGTEGTTVINAPAGSFGDFNSLHPFGPFTVTGSDSYLDYPGGMFPPGNGQLFLPLTHFDFWFGANASPAHPFTVQAVAIPVSAPDTPATVGLCVMAMVAFWGVRRRLLPA